MNINCTQQLTSGQTFRRFRFSAVFAGAWCLSGMATTNSGVAQESAPATPLALTISGGGTKGAYMAGHLYYVGMMARRSGAFQPRVFTGASAGAINSLVGLLTECGAEVPDPTQSLYWKAWTSIGIDQVFVPESTTATGLLTTAAYQPIITKMRELWQNGLPTSCDVLLGVVITPTSPRTVVLATGFPALPLSREAVLVRVTGQGPGRPPLVHNQIDTTRVTGQLLLPLDGPDAQPFESLAQLVLASAAFPLGFSPVRLHHCVREAGTRVEARCTPRDADSAFFMDGGVFDNQPLGLAIEAMRTLGFAPPGEGSFYFLDPRVLAYPTVFRETDTEEDATQDVLTVLGSLLGLVSSSESRELISTFEREPQVRDRLLLTKTYFPQTSSTFTGLLDHRFREFDFYLGMYNAARSIRDQLGAGAADLDAIDLPEDDSVLRQAWRPFHCLRAVYDGVGDDSVCDGDDMTDFRILLQLSLDRLTEDCRRVAASDDWTDAKVQAVDHPQCRAAMDGEPAPLVKGVRAIDAALKIQGANESPLHYQLRLLGLYSFHFSDLGLDRDEADEAGDQLIRLASRMLERFSNVQPRVARSMGVLTRIGVDMSLGYLPPVHSFHFTVGMGAELGYSVTIDDRDWNWLRFSAALAFDGMSTILNPADNYLAVIPKAGLEFEVFGRPDMQVRLGSRVGYQFSTADNFTTGDCDFANESTRPCSRLMTEAYAAVSVFGFIRIQLAGVFEPGLQTGQTAYWALRPTVGMQFNSPF